MKVSGRNKLKGKVAGVTAGIVTAELELDIGHGNVIAGVITKVHYKGL